MDLVIDVSKFNGSINWTKVKNSGVKGVICQLGYGGNTENQDDYTFINNVNGAYSVGLKVGAYLYSYAYSTAMAKDEAQHCMRLCSKVRDKLTMPIWYDLEETKYGNSAKYNMQAFKEELEKNGYSAGLYTGASYYKTYFGTDKKDYPLWIASYGLDNGYANDMYKPNVGEAIWQYSSAGRISGIKGNVDVNLDYRGENDDMTTDEVKKICNDMIYTYNTKQLEIVDKKFEKVIAELKPKIYNTIDDCPEWARKTIKKLCDKGIIQGNGKSLDLTYDLLRIYVSNDRAGLYD